MEILQWLRDLQGLGTELGVGNTVFLLILTGLLYLARLEWKRFRKKLDLLMERDVAEVLSRVDTMWNDRQPAIAARKEDREDLDEVRQRVEKLWLQYQKDLSGKQKVEMKQLITEAVAELMKGDEDG